MSIDNANPYAGGIAADDVAITGHNRTEIRIGQAWTSVQSVVDEISAPTNPSPA